MGMTELNLNGKNMKIENHQIAGSQTSLASKNKLLFDPTKLDTIIIHYTAGASAESSVATLTNPDVKASAHVVVGRDGAITQVVAFDTVAWHAGASQYGTRTGFNKYSIGIEIDNAGLLEKKGDKYYSWFGRAYEEEDVVCAVHRNEKIPRYWHMYTEKQIQVVDELCRVLASRYNLKYILGHEEISPIRKIDPGPAFPLDKLREQIFGGARDVEKAETSFGREGFVNTDLLNVRAEATVNAEKVAKPLVNGQKVKIIGTKDGWYKISTEVTGWVSSKYIK
jgi:N-acetylmuramoyl-L-alanine amidase